MPRLTLRRKLLLFTVVIAIVPLLIAGQTLIRIARDELKSAVNDQLVTTARQVSEEIDDIFEFAWVAPLLLIRNAIDAPNLSIEDKISLLTRGIADLDGVVALQITVAGSKLPLVVTRDSYAKQLMGVKVEPLTVLRSPVEVIEAERPTGTATPAWAGSVAASVAVAMVTPRLPRMSRSRSKARVTRMRAASAPTPSVAPISACE